MKTLQLDKDAEQMLTHLAHISLQGKGFEAFDAVKKLVEWVNTSKEVPDAIQEF